MTMLLTEPTCTCRVTTNHLPFVLVCVGEGVTTTIHRELSGEILHIYVVLAKATHSHNSEYLGQKQD